VRAPWLIDYEVASTLRLLAYRGELTVGESAGRFEDYLSLPIDKEHNSAVLSRAITLATDIGQPRAYDTAYLALAERYGAPLWTADRRFWNAAHERFPWVHQLR
jgi:predicted nucleic acid-binding protein